MPPETTTEYGRLPKDKKALVEALDNFVRSASTHYSATYLMMSIYYLYLTGVRDFRYIDFGRGQVSYNYIDFEDGRLQYQHMDLVKRYDDLYSRLMDLDFSPLVTTTQIGMRPSREKAAAQVVADAMSNPTMTEQMKAALCKTILLYGSAGMMTHLEDHPVIGMTMDEEVVSPWEVLPFPLPGMLQTPERGIMRRRMVSLKYVEKFHDKRKVAAHFKEMDAWEVQHGFQPTLNDVAAMNVIESGNLSAGGVSVRQTKGRDEEPPSEDRKNVLVEQRQVWLYGPQGTVARYIEQYGGWIAEDTDLWDSVVYCPLQFGRFKENGNWYGQGVVGLALGAHQQVEAMYARLFDFVRDLDRFGMVLFPQGTVDQNQFTESQYGMLLGFYEPDIAGGAGARPMQIAPNTPGAFPGQVAATGAGIIDGLLPTPGILQGDAPGRVDSTSGLMFLNQQANAAMATSSKTLAAMKGKADRYGVSEFARRIARGDISKERAIPVTRMDLSLIGSVFSNREGDNGTALGQEAGLGVHFDKNPIPDVSRLTFTIRESEPKMKVARKQEVIDEAREQRIDPLTFAIINIRENLGIPMDTGQIENTLRSATMSSLSLFGDGETPGLMIDNEFGGRADVIAHVIDEVMSMPEFLLASEKVQDAFIQWKGDVYAQMGQPLPGNTPPVDEAAVIFDQGGEAIRQLQQATQNIRGAP